MDCIASLQTSNRLPDLRSTWVQEPVRFKDALGRVLPIPSEYNWRVSNIIHRLQLGRTDFQCYKKLEAIILEQFQDGLGHQKVRAGEYELFNSLDSSQIVDRSVEEPLTPGLAITMAIIIGLYESGPLNRCPRPECRSTNVTQKEAGGIIWYIFYTLLTVNCSIVITIHSRIYQA